jgi:hypothetical protein
LAAQLLAEATAAAQLPDFLTLIAYPHLVEPAA